MVMMSSWLYSVDAASFANAVSLPRIEMQTLTRQQPDALLVLVEPEGVARARCALWWRNVPTYPDEQLGLIGHYHAADDEAARMLLQAACSMLQSNGCTLAIGPMNGNTWEKYRFVIEAGDEPPFLLEPTNPPAFPLHFTRAGFAVLATYISSLVPDLQTAVAARADRRVARTAQLMRETGITLRHLTDGDVNDPRLSHAFLQQVYHFSVAAFQHNYLYQLISEEAFFDMHGALLAQVRLVPELIWIAEKQGAMVGLLFGIPDWQQVQRGTPVDTVIGKTLAVDTAYGGLGVGGLLVDCFQMAALQLGYRRSLHALMVDGNRCVHIGAQYKHTIRRYALFARPLDREVLS